MYWTKSRFSRNEWTNKELVASFSAELLSMTGPFLSRAWNPVFVYISNMKTSLWHDKKFCQHLSISYTNKKKFALCNRIE